MIVEILRVDVAARPCGWSITFHEVPYDSSQLMASPHCHKSRHVEILRT
jgi:hypothetical protein